MRRIAFFLLCIAACSVTKPSLDRFFIPQPVVDAGPLLTRLPARPNGQPDRFGVIIGLNAEERHRNNISLAYQVLVESGVKSQDIFILDSSSATPIFPKSDMTSFSTVRLLMSTLASIVEDQDEIIVYVTGHGGFIEGEPYLVLNPGEFMASREFLASLDAIRPGRGLVVFDQCYWSIEYHPSSCFWTTITVAREGKVTVGDSFPRQFWYAIRAGQHQVEDALNTARENDPKTKIGENDPKIFHRTCGIKKTADDAIAF